MSSSIINASQVFRGCADRQRSPGELFRQEFECTQPGWYVPQSRAIIHNANDSLRCCNVKLCVSVKIQKQKNISIYNIEELILIVPYQY